MSKLGYEPHQQTHPVSIIMNRIVCTIIVALVWAFSSTLNAEETDDYGGRLFINGFLASVAANDYDSPHSNKLGTVSDTMEFKDAFRDLNAKIGTRLFTGYAAVGLGQLNKKGTGPNLIWRIDFGDLGDSILMGFTIKESKVVDVWFK